MRTSATVYLGRSHGLLRASALLKAAYARPERQLSRNCQLNVIGSSHTYGNSDCQRIQEVAQLISLCGEIAGGMRAVRNVRIEAL